jgi:hypothetical protein
MTGEETYSFIKELISVEMNKAGGTVVEEQ